MSNREPDGAESSVETPNPACFDCAENRPEEYERAGHYKNHPGRRTEMRCEGCYKKLGEYYRPVETDGGDRPSAGVTHRNHREAFPVCARGVGNQLGRR